jgi:hypothetical protein
MNLKHAGLAGLISLVMIAGSAFAEEEGGPSAERREHMRKMCHDNPEQCKAMMKERADKWWTKVDTNKDGMVSRDEANANAPRLARDFDKVDADGNGQVTRQELEAAGKQKRAERAQSGAPKKN